MTTGGPFQLPAQNKSQAAERHISPSLDLLQGWKFRNLSVTAEPRTQPLPVFYHPHRKTIFPISNQNFPFFQITSVASYAIATHFQKSGSPFSIRSSQLAEPSPPKAEQTQIPSASPVAWAPPLESQIHMTMSASF